MGSIWRGSGLLAFSGPGKGGREQCTKVQASKVNRDKEGWLNMVDPAFWEGERNELVFLG